MPRGKFNKPQQAKQGFKITKKMSAFTKRIFEMF